MRPELEDLRVLRLAQMYEEAYERFVVEVAGRDVRDPTLRKRLRRLSSPLDDHAGVLARHAKRIVDALGPDDQAALERALLRDVLEVERAAREFYLSHIDRLHDPGLVALFRTLAREEDAHARIAEDALAIADAHARRTALPHDEVARLRSLLDDADDVPLHEGTGDVGRPRRPPRPQAG